MLTYADREDYGACRGPLSLTGFTTHFTFFTGKKVQILTQNVAAQLRAIEREAASNCPAKCGEAAAAVRIAAIEVPFVCVRARRGRCVRALMLVAVWSARMLTCADVC